MLTAVAGLGVTQIIGWGTTFSSLTIFGTTIGVDLKLSREVVFGGITMMLLVSALIWRPASAGWSTPRARGRS